MQDGQFASTETDLYNSMKHLCTLKRLKTAHYKKL